SSPRPRMPCPAAPSHPRCLEGSLGARTDHQPASMERLAMRTLNVRFLLVLLTLGAGALGAVVVTHGLQTGRTARALLDQASAAEEQGQLQRRPLSRSRSLDFDPADVDQRARLGRLLASRELADSRQARDRAATVLEQVLGRDPDRRESRRLLARLAL